MGDGAERPRFELEDEPPSRVALPTPRKKPPPAAAAEPASGTSASGGTAKREREDDPEGPLGFLDERRRKRLLIYVPLMTILYVLVGWLFLGSGLGWFALAGAGVGAFAAWRQRGEILLGCVATVAGAAANLMVVPFLLFFVIVPTGAIGFLAGIDDRLRNS